MRLRAGTRGSKLARIQTRMVLDELKKIEPSLEFEIVVIKTKGDRILDSPLSKIGGKGLFTKEIEEEMLRGNIDLAVHSLKDLPTELPEGLRVVAVLEREDPRDAFVSFKYKSLEEMPENSAVGTSSLRRMAQINMRRKNLHLVELRGNVDTRVRKVKEGIVDGAVMALAGLKRMGLDGCARYVFSVDEFIPAPGQGVIVVEMKEDSPFIPLASKLDHRPTRKLISAERAFLNTIKGGCQVPSGAHAFFQDERRIRLKAFVSDMSGERVIKDEEEGEDPEELGITLGERFLKKGAGEIIEEVRKRLGK